MNLLSTLFCAAFLAAAPLTASVDLNKTIPDLSPLLYEGFKKVPDVAQYGGANWDNVIGIAHNVSLKEAQEIAKNDPNITFFFYTKGMRMVLVPTQDTHRVFWHGDAVFFSGTPWWGSAEGLADGYIKITNDCDCDITNECDCQ